MFGGERWFDDHYGYAADEVALLLGKEGIVLRDRDVAEIGHVWDWFPDEPFLALRSSDDEVAAMTRARPGADPAEVEDRLEIYRELNRITLDDLQRALVGAGFHITMVELLTSSARLPRGLDRRFRLSDLATAGVKLIAAAD